MRTFRFLAVYGMLVLMLGVGGASASAHSGTPLKSFKVQAGPYPVMVNYYTTPRAGQALVFTIVPDSAAARRARIRYTATAVPGTMVNAVPVKAELDPDVDNAGAVGGTVNLPVTGQWLLSIDLDGALGPGQGDAPILAAAPPAIPEWMGWLIGMLPIWGILGFLIAQARRAGRAAGPALV